jgi:hypothetical protein
MLQQQQHGLLGRSRQFLEQQQQQHRMQQQQAQQEQAHQQQAQQQLQLQGQMQQLQQQLQDQALMGYALMQDVSSDTPSPGNVQVQGHYMPSFAASGALGAQSGVLQQEQQQQQQQQHVHSRPLLQQQYQMQQLLQLEQALLPEMHPDSVLLHMQQQQLPTCVHSGQLLTATTSFSNAAAAAAAGVVGGTSSSSSIARFHVCHPASASFELLQAAAAAAGSSGPDYTSFTGSGLGSCLGSSAPVLSSLIDVREQQSPSTYSCANTPAQVSAASLPAAGSSVSSSSGPLRGARAGAAAAVNMAALQTQLQKMALAGGGGDSRLVQDL